MIMGFLNKLPKIFCMGLIITTYWIQLPEKSFHSHPILNSYSAGQVLKIGMAGGEVSQLQRNLQTLGYFELSPTGYFGKVTEQSLKRFQRESRLYEDGIYGMKTREEISARLNRNISTLRLGSRGGAVIRLQEKLKEFGYFNFSITGYYGSITQTAVKGFQRDKGITVDGIAGKRTLEILYQGVNTNSSRGSSLTGDLVAWFNEASNIFYLGADAVVTDLKTGKSFHAKRTGGYNHADTETLTKKDTDILIEIYGGGWSWERRAVVVAIGDRRIAASMTGMPHAGRDDLPARQFVHNRSGGYGSGINYDSIKGNGMDGHFDIHFLNSRTHGTNRVDEMHSRMVLKAAGR
jgi:peptidoglycan hydrolase-like protein with peptidoglycan-binding domain